MAFTYVTVTHTFEVANDVSAAGSVEFTPVAPMQNEITVVAAPVKATLTVAGAISQKLAANTDPGTIPTGTTYKVVERLTGQPVLTYYVQVPHDQGTVLDLRTLAGWVGGGVGGGVDSVNGRTGAITLAASDVGAQLADADLTGLAALGDGVPVRTAGTWGVATGTRDGTHYLRDDGTWQTVASGAVGIPASTVDAKGDLIAGTANDTVARLGVGTNGLALVASSVAATGLAWAAPAPATHTHAATDLASGTVATARLGLGTASATTFLRGDQTYADPSLLAPLVHAVGNSGAALTIDASSTAGYIKTITLTANCTFTLAGAAAGRATTLELVLTQDATGSRTVTWPASVKWSGGAPTLSTAAGAIDRIVLTTYNAGTAWQADLIGKGYA